MQNNPYGSNQFVLDPRQKLCWDLYVNPKSETFHNAYRSAIKAGYEETYATQITTARWFIDKEKRLNLLNKAEEVLEDTLNMSTQTVKKVGDEEVIIEDPALIKIKQDSAKFVAERVGKHIYSTRNELTGKDGEQIQINVLDYKNSNNTP